MSLAVRQEGWLWKVGAIVPSWKRRYFVLTSGRLAYYDKNPALPTLPASSSVLALAASVAAEGPGQPPSPLGEVDLSQGFRVERLAEHANLWGVLRRDCVRLFVDPSSTAAAAAAASQSGAGSVGSTHSGELILAPDDDGDFFSRRSLGPFS